MIISRDKEFIRRKDEARQPAREPVKDTLAGKDRSVQDYDLRRARDAPLLQRAGTGSGSRNRNILLLQ